MNTGCQLAVFTSANAALLSLTPLQIAVLPALCHLWVGSTLSLPIVPLDLSAEAASQLCQLTALQGLELRNCPALPACLSGLHTLTRLSAGVPDADGSVLSLRRAVPQLTQLRELDLTFAGGDMAERAGLPASLSSLCCLTRLCLMGCLPAGSHLPEGPWMALLEELCADAPLVSASRTALLAHATRLRVLLLPGCLDRPASHWRESLSLALGHPSVSVVVLRAPVSYAGKELEDARGLLEQAAAAFAAEQPALWEQRQRRPLSIRCICRHPQCERFQLALTFTLFLASLTHPMHLHSLRPDFYCLRPYQLQVQALSCVCCLCKCLHLAQPTVLCDGHASVSVAFLAMRSCPA